MSERPVPTWLAELDADELTDLACNVYESHVRRNMAVRELARRREEIAHIDGDER